MLQDIRKSTQGNTAKVIIGVIVISFALFGIESILLGGGGTSMAEVNGEEISAFEVQQAVNNQKRQIINMLGDNLDPAMLDDDRLTPQAVQTIINRKLQTQSAADMDLAVSEREVGLVISRMEDFFIDGQFSPEMYKSVLANAGFTPASFKQGLVEDLILNQLRSGLAGSDFATPAELAATAKATAELRDIRYLTMPLADFRTEAQLTEEEILAYYESNQDAFLTEETVVLEYIELHVDDFREPVSEDQLIEEFELVKSDYEYQTENRVSHILFEQGADENDEALQARVEEARMALEGGKAFAEVATEFSDDIGSSAAGGDLGYSAGEAFPPEMEEAIAALAIEQVSEPVTTDAGVHLILLTDRREGKAITLDDIR
ncbi:MAG: SurA N-terminal domain-containing protein, partial [Halieaceae bacterium]